MIARYGAAVAATSPVVRLAVLGDVAAAIDAGARDGVTPQVHTWWHTFGLACADAVAAEMGCPRLDAEWAAAAVMHARCAAGEPLDGTDEVTDEVISETKNAVAWDAGTRRASTAQLSGG